MITLLTVISGILGGEAQGVYLCRFEDFGMDELPADNIIPEDEDPEYLNTDDVEQKGRFTIRHLVAQRDGALLGADARYVRGAQLLLADKTLGGLVQSCKLLGRKWEKEKATLEVMACVATYEIQYSTSLGDPSVAGY